MKPSHNAIDYKTFRFAWKRALLADPSIGNAAKSAGVLICDHFVNKSSGTFWAANETLSVKLGKSVRSVQRYIETLTEAGWLVPRKKKGVRRTLLIVIPQEQQALNEHDTERANLSVSAKKKLTHERVKTDAPYTNQGKNQEKQGDNPPAFQRQFKFVPIDCDEDVALSEWRAWLTQHYPEQDSQIWELLEKNGRYMLPCRYPKDEDSGSYTSFFAMVLSTEGKFLG